NMIPDVTPNGVFYLPPTGWLTSFYNPPFKFLLVNYDSLFVLSLINILVEVSRIGDKFNRVVELTSFESPSLTNSYLKIFLDKF
ncbi:hypothetical protein FOL87_10115, partial [Lactobacillus reuteri]|nr:hypothetical protein [Limosilactobacillus reuteri]